MKHSPKLWDLCHKYERARDELLERVPAGTPELALHKAGPAALTLAYERSRREYDAQAADENGIAFENDHERHCFENAVYFTVCRGRRPNLDRWEYPTFVGALIWAEYYGGTDGRSMIYAVTAEGRDAHICNR